ncbi:hypothetical protein BDR07DRAFT_1415000 [Suillus spraguei]|nr:hypothetical protein BDR07DRAFT_1415000 [Suillus spraguei]
MKVYTRCSDGIIMQTFALCTSWTLQMRKSRGPLKCLADGTFKKVYRRHIMPNVSNEKVTESISQDTLTYWRYIVVTHVV